MHACMNTGHQVPTNRNFIRCLLEIHLHSSFGHSASVLLMCMFLKPKHVKDILSFILLIHNFNCRKSNNFILIALLCFMGFLVSWSLKHVDQHNSMIGELFLATVVKLPLGDMGENRFGGGENNQLFPKFHDRHRSTPVP